MDGGQALTATQSPVLMSQVSIPLQNSPSSHVFPSQGSIAANDDVENPADMSIVSVTNKTLFIYSLLQLAN
jgi:hypothetical protein